MLYLNWDRLVNKGLYLVLMAISLLVPLVLNSVQASEVICIQTPDGKFCYSSRNRTNAPIVALVPIASAHDRSAQGLVWEQQDGVSLYQIEVKNMDTRQVFPVETTTFNLYLIASDLPAGRYSFVVTGLDARGKPIYHHRLTERLPLPLEPIARNNEGTP